MATLEGILPVEQPRSLSGHAANLFDAAYGGVTGVMDTGKGMVNAAEEFVTEHPFKAAAAAATTIALLALTRGRSARAVVGESTALAEQKLVSTGVSAVSQLSRPAAGVAGRLVAPEAGIAVSDTAVVPILKGPWNEAAVSQVSLPANHWVARAYANSRHAVVEVLQNGQRQGTGFFVDGSGLAVTNHHVVGTPRLVYELGLSDGSRVAARVVSIDPGADLAILRVTQTNARHFPFLRLGSSTGRSAEQVVAVGLPEEAAVATASPGSYLGHQTIATKSGVQKHVAFDMVMKRGNSGSPVLDMDGHVAAVLNRYSFSDQAYGPAVEHLKALLSATRASNTGSRYLVVTTGTERGTGGLLARLLGRGGAEPVGTSAANALSEPFVAGIRRKVLTSRPPLSL